MSTQNSIIRVMEEKWELIGKREEEFCLFGRREGEREREGRKKERKREKEFCCNGADGAFGGKSGLGSAELSSSIISLSIPIF